MDDVTQDKPLSGGRQRANHIQVHRIEAGLWERKHLLKPVGEIADSTAKIAETVRIVQTVAVVGAAGALVTLSYVAYKVGKALYGWTEDVFDTIKTNEDAFRTYNTYGGFGAFSGLTRMFGLFQKED